MSSFLWNYWANKPSRMLGEYEYRLLIMPGSFDLQAIEVFSIQSDLLIT